jgi:hypothetical protein
MKMRSYVIDIKEHKICKVRGHDAAEDGIDHHVGGGQKVSLCKWCWIFYWYEEKIEIIQHQQPTNRAEYAICNLRGHTDIKKYPEGSNLAGRFLCGLCGCIFSEDKSTVLYEQK